MLSSSSLSLPSLSSSSSTVVLGAGCASSIFEDQSFRHLSQRLKFSFFDERVFGDEKIEMLVASVDVSFGADGHQLVKVVNVDVDKHAEQTGQDLFACRSEVVGEGHVHSHRK